MTNASRGPSRRTLVKGAAWSVPVVAVAGAAPAVANSPIPPNGLNGWVQLERNCSANWEFRINGQGNYPNRGIWTFIPDSDAEITFAEIVFFFNRSNLSFSNQSGPGWTNLARDTDLDPTSPASGYYAYRATYTGGWTYFGTPSGEQRWEANSDPYWYVEDLNSCSQGICAYARRAITVNGNTVTFTRGPVCV